MAHLSKRQLKEDPFLEAVQSALAYARDNVVVVIIGVIVFVAAVVLAVRIGGSFTGRHPTVGNPAAQRALADARTQFALGHLDEGITALGDLQTSHQGTRAAREANYILGSAYYEKGDWANAEKSFQEFLKKPVYGTLMTDGAKIAIAACKEQSGDLAGAYTGYREVWDTGTEPGTRLEAGFSAARCARLQGNTTEARAIYQAIVDRYPDAPETDDARFELLTLEQPAPPVTVKG